NGRRLAETIRENYRDIYREPDNIDLIPTTALAEIRRTKAPAVLIEVAYHDNPVEAQWIRDNIDVIGKNLAKSVAEYLGVPFVEPK
ncbi:MAG: N-acetylmuramoyl-L-alanine amidase, partial [Ruminococcus sp.]|nr:N-acetylmuramoyl-L-alanine amidase [Ruminococcus sp.]